MDENEKFFTCPYCWDTISVVVDTSVETQSYVEDCENCCHPIQITYRVEDDVVIEFETLKIQ